MPPPQELLALSEQRMGALNSRTRDIEDRLRGKETEIAQVGPVRMQKPPGTSLTDTRAEPLFLEFNGVP